MCIKSQANIVNKNKTFNVYSQHCSQNYKVRENTTLCYVGYLSLGIKQNGDAGKNFDYDAVRTGVLNDWIKIKMALKFI